MMAPDNLLDVLAAAGAARASEQHFALPNFATGIPPTIPAISREQAEHFVADLRAMDFSHLRMSSMDLLRGLGQMPTLDLRAADIASHITPEHIIAYAADSWPPFRRPGKKYQDIPCSLRWEIAHPSDTPAAQRWIGSRPHPRTSNPGRNALALSVVTAMDIPLLSPFHAAPSDGEMRARGFPSYVRSFGAPRYWFSPRILISFEAWRTCQLAGPQCNDPCIHDCGEWWISKIMNNNRMYYLDRPCPYDQYVLAAGYHPGDPEGMARYLYSAAATA
jgi:hypothetical protein